MENNIQAIDKRYSKLAQDQCCLSCGKALESTDVREGDVCLDLGSGRGTDVIRMAEAAGPSGFAYGIDISDGMLEKAKQNAVLLGVKNVEFIKTELENIPLADNSVNIVISNCTINHAGDKWKVWSEIYRVLKPGGFFTISDIYSTVPVPEEYANDPDAVAECWAGSVTRDMYMSILSGTGFKDITVLEESAPYDKGAIQVASFTVRGYKHSCCCSK